MDGLERAAFELEQDQVSGILEQGGRYYILKCVNAYDEEATAARKSRLAQEKKTKAFLGIYEPYVKEHIVKLKKLPGDVVEFSGGEGCTADNFSSCITDISVNSIHGTTYKNIAFDSGCCNSN